MTEGAAAAEIARLHRVIEAWVRGAADAAAFAEGFENALHEAFEMVSPEGQVSDRRRVVEDLRAAGASNPDFRIAVDGVRLIGVWPGLVLAGYVERQSSARRAATRNARRSTAALVPGERLLWRHLHETWLQID